MPKKLVVAGLFVLAMLLSVVGTVFVVHRPNSRLAATEQYTVYSTYLESEIAENFHDYGTGRDFVLLIQDKTTVARVAAPRLQRLKKDAPTLQDATLMNFVAQNVISQALGRQFRLSVNYELLPEGQLLEPDSLDAKHPAHAGYVTVSRVGFNKDLSQALFYTEHICGLCGGGGYVLMVKRFGQWRLRAFLSTWTS